MCELYQYISYVFSESKIFNRSTLTKTNSFGYLYWILDLNDSLKIILNRKGFIHQVRGLQETSILIIG